MICDVCDDLGIVQVVRRNGERNIIPCPCCDKGAEAARRKRDTLPEHYRHFTLAGFDEMAGEARQGKMLARAAAEVFVKRCGEAFCSREIYSCLGFHGGEDIQRLGLVFSGLYGVGKTGMAATITNELRVQGQHVLFVICKDFLTRVQQSYGDESLRGYRASVQTAPILVVDEFNLQSYTPDRLEIIEQLIEYRNANRLPSVLTTNLTRAAFEAQWGSFTASRVFANCHWVTMAGRPLRHEGTELVDPMMEMA